MRLAHAHGMARRVSTCVGRRGTDAAAKPSIIGPHTPHLTAAHALPARCPRPCRAPELSCRGWNMTASATHLGRPLNAAGGSGGGGGSYQQPYFSAVGGVEGPSLLQRGDDSFSRKYYGVPDPTTSGLLGGGGTTSQPYRYGDAHVQHATACKYLPAGEWVGRHVSTWRGGVLCSGHIRNPQGWVGGRGVVDALVGCSP